MPDHLKNAPESKEFQKYLQNFMKKKERQHRKNILREVAASLSLMLVG